MMIGEDLSRVFQRLCAVNEQLSHWDKARDLVSEVAEIISEVRHIRDRTFGRVLVDPAKMTMELERREAGVR